MGNDSFRNVPTPNPEQTHVCGINQPSDASLLSVWHNVKSPSAELIPRSHLHHPATAGQCAQRGIVFIGAIVALVSSGATFHRAQGCLHRKKTNLDPTVERRRDAAQHAQGMAK
jgi:hypothetical protein